MTWDARGNKMPLAIDLFCGLEKVVPKPKLLRRAYAAIKEGMAGRAQYPNHIWLHHRHRWPYSVTRVFRLVCHIQDAPLCAAFAGVRNIRKFPAQPSHLRRSSDLVFLSMPYPHFLAVCWVAVKKIATTLLCTGARALKAAISLIGARRRDWKVIPAPLAVGPRLGDIGLFQPAQSPSVPSAARRAPLLIGANGLECLSAIVTKQIIHNSVST